MTSLASYDSLNSQLDSIHRIDCDDIPGPLWRIDYNKQYEVGPHFQSYIFTPDRSLEPLTYDAQNDLGIAATQFTGVFYAFRIGPNAKPAACRDYRAESRVYLYEIETVADAQGIIRGDLGKRTMSLGRPRIVLK